MWIFSDSLIGVSSLVEVWEKFCDGIGTVCSVRIGDTCRVWVEAAPGEVRRGCPAGAVAGGSVDAAGAPSGGCAAGVAAGSGGE